MAKVKKRALSIALVLAMLLSLSVTAFAAQNDVSIEPVSYTHLTLPTNLCV